MTPRPRERSAVLRRLPWRLRTRGTAAGALPGPGSRCHAARFPRPVEQSHPPPNHGSALRWLRNPPHQAPNMSPRLSSPSSRQGNFRGE